MDDERGEAVLEGGGAGGEAGAHERDALGVDVGPLQGGVDDRADDGLPVWPEGQALVAQHRALPGAMEGDAGVAASGGGSGGEVGLLQDGVIAAVVDERGAP